MTHDPNDIRNGELDQARLTAHALEQLEGAERAAVEALLAGSDRSRHTVEEIRALAAEVKKAAGQEALPPRSPELQAVLEQYLPNEEASEMNAKPEPSSEKAPRHGRRRSTLIWAAAVCALVAVIPGYVLISGSLGPEPRSVALEDSVSEAPASSIAVHDALSWESFEGEESAGEPLMRRALVDTLYDAEASFVPFPDGPPIVIRDKRLQPKNDGSVEVRRAAGQALTVRSLPLGGMPSRPASAAMPAEPKPMEVADESRRVGGKKGATVGMEAPGVFSADSDIPMSADAFGTQATQSSRLDDRSASTAPKSAVSESDEIPTDGKPLYATKNPRSRGAGGAPGMMMGGMGMDMRMGMEMEMEELNVDRPMRFGHRPAPVELQTRERAYSGPQSPVDVEKLAGRDLVILKGKAEDGWTVKARIAKKEEEAGLYLERRLPRRSVLGTEQYDPIVENPFLLAADNPESTFSVDVDTASYANVRRFLDSGRLPPPNAVRIEELVNYFRYDYPQPDDEAPFSVNMETAQCPWDTEHRLVRIGLKGREIDPEQRGPSNLVFLLDVSGSMRDENKLPLVQYAMGMLVDQLTEDDRVAIVTYAGDAGVALDSTSGEKRKKIRRAINRLSAGGSTHGSAGIVMAYDQAMQHFVKNGTNRVILCTDGDLNVGITDDGELVKLIARQAKSGVFLTVLGFGTGNLKDSKMEKLADRGNGIYAYVDGRREARRVLVEQMAGSLVTIAKDVKIQIEFNPAEVRSYRLIGYENRIMAAEDFANDKKDAGEIGAGHTVTALYEIVPGGADSGGALGRELKYQRKTGRELTEAAASGELFTLKLRYKEPEGKKSKLLKFVQKDSDNRFGRASADFRFASSVAAFGMLLRGSQHAGDLDWSAVEEFAAGSLGEDPGGYRNEFLELVHRAGELGSR